MKLNNKKKIGEASACIKIQNELDDIILYFSSQ